MSEEPARELMLLLRERFPSVAEVRAEAQREIPAVWVEDRRCYRKGGSGLTRWEWLLLMERAGRR